MSPEWCRPQHSDHDEHAARLRDLLAAQQCRNVLVVSRSGTATTAVRRPCGDYVRHLVKVVREIAATPGEAPERSC
jgi:hypothetical protein